MNYYNEIKNKLVDNEVYKKVKDYSKNRNDLTTYYNVGKLLNEAGKHYGENIIQEYSKKLRLELGKNYSVRLLYKMVKYFRFVSNQKLPTLSAKLSWSHYDELLRFDDSNIIFYYMKISEQQNLSIRQLREKIKSKEYERLPVSTRNKLVSNAYLEVQDLVKDPIIIKNTSDIEIISEKVLKMLILEDIPSFLKELGNGFCFIDQEYKIMICNTYNYIDILLYNINYNCYVVL